MNFDPRSTPNQSSKEAQHVLSAGIGRTNTSATDGYLMKYSRKYHSRRFRTLSIQCMTMPYWERQLTCTVGTVRKRGTITATVKKVWSAGDAMASAIFKLTAYVILQNANGVTI